MVASKYTSDLTTRTVLAKRLRPLYLVVFFQNFIFWYAIEKLFMKNIGFTDSGIATATIIFTTATLLVNIPLGLIADKWSRKAILLAGSLFLASSSLICGLSSEPLAYTFGLAMWGVFLGCYSGTYESIVYDTVMEEAKSPELYEYFYGRIALYSTLALITGAFASSLISDWLSLRTAYLVSIPLVLASLVPLYYFKEPKLHKAGIQRVLFQHIGDILRSLKQGRVISVAISLVLVSTAMRMTLEFGPLWLVKLSLPVLLYGPAIALIQLNLGLSGLLAHRLRRRPLYIYLVAMGTLAISLVLITQALVLIVIGLAALALGYMLLTISLSRFLHDDIPSQIRAGSASFVSTIGYIFFLPLAGLFGVVSDNNGIFTAGWIITGVTGLLAAVVFWVLHQRRLLFTKKIISQPEQALSTR